VYGPEDLLVDLALDSAPGRPAAVSIAGPTFALDELAGRKLVALFDCAAARYFVDMYALHHTFNKDVLLERAAEVDVGFNQAVLAEMLEHLARYAGADRSLGAADVAELRAFSQEWVVEIRSRSG